MPFTSFESYFDAFNSLRVLVIGDVMVDSYLWGKADRISPEAPVPVVSVLKRERRLGGAANVAKNIAALGAKPILCALVGDDHEGGYLLDLLEENDFSKDGIVVSNERKTSVKKRVISGSQQLLRVDSEDTHDLTPKEYEHLQARILDLLPDADVVIFEDYDKGVITPELITVTVEKARQLGVPTVVDPKKKNFLAYKNVTMFKPNLKELREGLNIACDPTSQESLLASVAALRTVLNQELALITLSEHGAFIASKAQSFHVPAHYRDISDVSGAGDTVISTAALCLALGSSLKTIVEIANLAGGLVCEHVGVVPISKATLLKESKAQLKLEDLSDERVSL